MPDARSLRQAVEACRNRPGAPRVQALDHRGQRYWLKIPRERGLLLRLRKGSARALFEREAGAIAALRDRGLPVPAIALRGDDFLLLEDAGQPLDVVLEELDDPGARVARIRQGARALAGLHRAGVAHGSAHLRNLCVADGRIVFIDLEGATVENAGVAACAHDLRVLIFSTFARFPGDHALAGAALAAYGETAQPQVLRASRIWARRHGWLALLAAPLKWHEDRFRPDRRNRQYGAVRDTLALLARS